MIQVPRDRPDEAGQPIRPDPSWFDEARRATARALREAARHVPQRKIYGHEQVRKALEKLFHDKCAYCESEITAGLDWEVEHFRPKRGVAERPDHAGYYWLVYEWANLYPSCTFCNQRRRDRPRWGDCTLAGTGGKGIQFPLEEESSRALNHDQDLTLEKRLLLDPCCDAPETILAYDVTGEILSHGDNPRGLATISVFHLKRRRLKAQRRGIVNAVADLLRLLEGRKDELSAAARADLEEWLERYFLSDDRPYAAMARSILRDPEAFGLPRASSPLLLARWR